MGYPICARAMEVTFGLPVNRPEPQVCTTTLDFTSRRCRFDSRLQALNRLPGHRRFSSSSKGTMHSLRCLRSQSRPSHCRFCSVKLGTSDENEFARSSGPFDRPECFDRLDLKISGLQRIRYFA